MPSRFAPIFTRVTDAEVGPVASNTSARDIVEWTARPVFFDSSATSGSR